MYKTASKIAQAAGRRNVLIEHGKAAKPKKKQKKNVSRNPLPQSGAALPTHDSRRRKGVRKTKRAERAKLWKQQQGTNPRNPASSLTPANSKRKKPKKKGRINLSVLQFTPSRNTDRSI